MAEFYADDLGFKAAMGVPVSSTEVVALENYANEYWTFDAALFDNAKFIAGSIATLVSAAIVLQY